MIPSKLIIIFTYLMIAASAATMVFAKGAQSAQRSKSKMVAYDAKDKRYYSVDWAVKHHMHDKGGDPLTIVALSQLPKDAKLSRQMHGKL